MILYIWRNMVWFSYLIIDAKKQYTNDAVKIHGPNIINFGDGVLVAGHLKNHPLIKKVYFQLNFIYITITFTSF